jgi:hypothetical protein
LFNQYRRFHERSAEPAQCRDFLLEHLMRDESRGLLATVDARAAGVAPLYGGFSRPAELASGTLA